MVLDWCGDWSLFGLDCCGDGCDDGCGWGLGYAEWVTCVVI